MEDNESLYYFQKRLSELGVNQKLKDAGVQEGDTVKVFDYLLEWEDQFEKNYKVTNFCLTNAFFYDNIVAEIILGVISMARKRDPLELNKREKDILKFIETELNENGYPP